MKKYIVMLVAAVMLSGCSSQMMTRQFGGSTNLNLACNNQLKTISWDKEHNLWYLEEPITNVDAWAPQTYVFKEQSQFGIFQGSISITESKCKTLK